MRANYLWAKLILTLLMIISVSFIYADCKLIGLIGLNGANLSDTYYPHTWDNFTGPCLAKLKDMGRYYEATGDHYPNDNPHGWAFSVYGTDQPSVTYDERNIQMAAPFDNAYTSTGYDNAVDYMRYRLKPRIILGHIRKASSNQTQTHGIIDPHPFKFFLHGKEFTFVHNGGINWESVNALIGTNWYDTHPDHQIDYYGNPPVPVDSQIYFNWIMKNIEEQGGDIQKGLKNALYVMTNVNHSALNFILTDGTDLYAYKYTFVTSDTKHELAYFYDTIDTKNNYYYCGVMSIFPNGETINNVTLPDWTIGNDDANNIQTHKIENGELVYISSNGNIVRLPNFAYNSSTYAVDKYRQKRDFHKGYNWVGLPILPINTQTQSVAVSPLLNYYLQSANGGIQRIEYQNEVILAEYPSWSNPDYQLNMTKLYKMDFNSDSPSIHTATGTTATSITLMDARLYPEGAVVLNTVVPFQEYWLSYTLLPTQNIVDAFGNAWNNVASIQAENWFYQRPIISGKSEGPTEDPIFTYTPAGKNMNFGKGYIVKFYNDNNQQPFAWNRAMLREIPSPEPQKPEFFEWEDDPEYLVIDIVQSENEPDILEVGAFQGENCIGAVKPDKFPCQLLVYPKYEDPNPVTFQIIYKGKSLPKSCRSYLVYQPELSDYFTDMIIPEKNTNYVVKLSDDTPSQNISAINPLVSVSSYPNPFNPNTSVSFALKHASDIHVSIYNIKGQMVKDFGKSAYNAGIHRLNWNGKDNREKQATGGIYFVRVDSGKNMLTHKIVMLK